jgi:hypothetical protein
MLDLDSFLVSLYVLVDDWWKLEHSSEPPKAVRPALLTDPEVITLAILAQWPRFRSERDFWRFAWAYLRPYFPKLCSQSRLNRRRVRSVEPDLRDFQRAVARKLCGVSEAYHVLDTTLIPAIVRVRASRKRAVCRAGHLREERLQDRVGLRLQGGAFGQPRGRDLRLRACGGVLRRAPHRGLSHHRGLSRSLPGRQGLYGRSVGTTLVGSLWSVGSSHSQRQLQEGVGENRSALGFWQAPDQ